jgi:hypothetical protein
MYAVVGRWKMDMNRAEQQQREFGDRQVELASAGSV